MPSSSSSPPVLYSFRRCPYAMRARLALVTVGVDWVHREVLLKNKPAAMLEASSKGTVPVLVLPDGQVIDESIDIMRWAFREHAPTHPWVDDPAIAEETRMLVETNDGEFKHHLDRYKYATRYDDVDEIEEREAADTFVAQLEARLGRARFLFGDSATFADAAIFPFIRQFSRVDTTRFAAAFEKTQAWLDAWEEAPSFQSIIVKIPPWSPGDELLIMPTQGRAP